MKKVFSGHQPNFMPYMGVFYKMFKSDVFVLDDDVQYSNEGLHNANFLKIGGQKHKVTIPVSVNFGDVINKAEICYERKWVSKLLRSIEMNYGKAKYFDEGYSIIEDCLNFRFKYLSDLNIALICEFVERFEIDTEIVIASKDVPTSLKNNERNVYQCMKLGANVYYSGIGGKDYNDEKLYEENGIKVVYSDYTPIVYDQVGKGDFIENLSVLDYVMNEGFNLPEEWIK